jgi:hypothetical protein
VTITLATAALAASRTAMHGMLMVLVIILAAVAFGVIRWRHRRDEAQAQMQPGKQELQDEEKHPHSRPGA